MILNESVTIFLESIPLLVQGARMTVTLWIASALISVSVGTVWGLLMCRAIKIPILSALIGGITFIARAVPYYVQLLIAYFAIPAVIGIPLSAPMAGILALGICSSGYVANIIRAGINAIPQGQWQACAVLGYRRRQTLWYCILPQTITIIVPTLMNELDSLLKSTAIISSIGVLELTRMGMNVVSRYMNPISMYLAIAFVYVVLSFMLMIISKFIQRRYCNARN